MRLWSREIVARTTSETLGRLGYQIGEHPFGFLIVPLMISIILGTGIQRMIYIDDAEYLFSPRDGQGKQERALVQHHFPLNQSGGFSPSRLTRMCRIGRVVAIAKDGGSVLRQQIFEELLTLDSVVRNVTVHYEGGTYRYEQLCAHWKGQCIENSVLLLAKNMKDIENGSQLLHYPITFDSDEYKLIVLPAFLGGLQRENDSDLVLDATAVAMGYFVRSQTPTENHLGRLWEEAFVDAVTKLHLERLEVVYFTSETLQRELNDSLKQGTSYVFLSIALMLLFSALTCMSFDCVRSKSWLSMTGVLSTTVGIVAAFGLLIYCGLEFAGVNYAIPFLALGIGLDDTFVMISCWQQTDPNSSVPQRLKTTMEKAGVSITITSLTDFLSFWIGVVTPFEAIRMFCIYIATTVLFVYISHVTLFAAFMAYSGYLEKDQRHGFICIRILPPSQAKNRNIWYRIFCTGGPDPVSEPKTFSEPKYESGEEGRGKGRMAEVIAAHSRDRMIDKLKHPDPCLANTLAKWIDNVWVNIGVFSGFLIYLGVSIWGLYNLREDLDVRNLCRYNSNATRYYDLDSLYFKQYRLQIMITGHVNYWEESTQDKVSQMLEAFENRTDNDVRLLTESWLRSFLTYVQYTHLTVDDEPTFIEELRKFVRGSVYELDIKFSSDGRHIEASRFMIQTEAVTDTILGTQMMEEFRQLARSFQDSLQITVFNPYFVYFDQFIMVRPYTIQCVLVAAVVMIVVATLFLPHFISTLCIALSMLSIEIGVIGLMSFWNIRLDAIAMINLIMCIGFSVDFSAHVTHAFLSAPIETRTNIRLRLCHVYRTAGLPVLQGASSTILALLPLLLVPSYISEVFFRLTFLVSVLGAIHALILLPTLLSVLHSRYFRKRSPTVQPESMTSPSIVSVPPIVEKVVVVVPQMVKASVDSEDEEMEELADDDVGLGTSADESSVHSNTSTPHVEARSSNTKKEGGPGTIVSVELQHFTPQHGLGTYPYPSSTIGQQ